MLRWSSEDRETLLANLRYAEVTPLATEDAFPKMGDPRLVEFWLRATVYKNTIGHHRYKPGKEPEARPQLFPVYASGSSRYFIAAMPNAMRSTGLNVFLFESEWMRDVAMVCINSNIFYWLWTVLGDSFHVTGENTLAMVLPKVFTDDEETKHLRDRLLSAAESCATYHLKWGEWLPNYNFNKRMDILLDIDDWIVKQVAPDLNLPRDIFAQYKSNSFLRPLDLSAITGAAADVEGEE